MDWKVFGQATAGLIGLGTILGGWIYQDDRMHAIAKEKADEVATKLIEGKDEYAQALDRFQYNTQEYGIANQLADARSAANYYGAMLRMHPNDRNARQSYEEARRSVQRLEQELQQYKRGNRWR